MKTTLVATIEGPREVDVHSESGGLAVTASVDAPGVWNVTHVPSGRTVVRDCSSAEAAAAAMELMLEAGDWFRAESEIMADLPLLVRAARTRESLRRLS